MSEQATEKAQDGTKGSRVVLRGVQAIVLDDLSGIDREAILATVNASAERAKPREAWVAVAARTGTNAGAITDYAGPSGAPGNRPGSYKAVPAASWFVSPLVVEPPLG